MEKENKLNEQEILEIIKSNLEKGITIENLSKKLDLNELEIMGLIKKLKDNGLKIDYFETNGKTILKLNNSPDFTKDNIYELKVENGEKIAYIASPCFGSKSEQIEILNDLYLKFKDNNITKVVIIGNLLEGPYTKNDYEKFGSSLITNDPIEQANHLIEYFPKIEGITTYFVTGENDHKASKKENIGKYIEENRDDFIYLGPVGCDLIINKSKIRVEQLKKGDTYTLAYPIQKYMRSMSTYDNYDAIILGGSSSMQHFPSLRQTEIFSVPSISDRTAKMRNNRILSTMGAVILEYNFNKNGTLNKILPTFISYNETSKKTYQNLKPLDLIKDENGLLIDNKQNKVETNKLDKIYNQMKKEEEFYNLANRLGLNENELYGVIELLIKNGKKIEIVNIDNKYIVRKNSRLVKADEIKPRKEELHKKTFGVVSDTHYGSIYSQPSMVNTFCYEAYNRGIEDMFHVGDIVDGDYSKIRPLHVHEVFLYGATGQLWYAAKTLPKYKNMKWHAITGSHDQTHLFNYGLDLGKELEKLRPDFEFLGQDKGEYKFDNCKIELFHPGGGSSRILSTVPQNGIDQLSGIDKPNLSLRGHYHKVYYMLYRNIHTFLVPCNVAQSSFMMKNELPNLMGDYFITIYYDDNGVIHYIEPELMLFDENDVRENDYENPKKYIKNKIIKLK